jgi:hypothetical protein
LVETPSKKLGDRISQIYHNFQNDLILSSLMLAYERSPYSFGKFSLDELKSKILETYKKLFII